MATLSSINAGRAANGQAPVVIPGRTQAPTSAAPAPGTTTYDPSSRTISGPGAAAAGAQSTQNRGGTPDYTGVYVPPNARNGQAAVDSQNAIYAARAPNEPQEVQTFSQAGAKLLEGGYTPDTVNRYVQSGQLTQDQANKILEKSSLTPDEALALGLGKTVTVRNQQEMQGLIKSNLADRQKNAAAELAAGLITQDEYDATVKDVTTRTADADRIISDAQNPYLAKSASGAQSTRLDELNRQISELGQPQNYDNYLSFMTHEEIAKTIQARDQMKASLEREKAALLEQQRKGQTNNIQAYGADRSTGDRTTTPGATDQSRAAVVQDLIRQGLTDPRDMLDVLNFDENGQRVGDFTLPEITALMQQQQQGQSFPQTSTMGALQAMIDSAPPEQKGFLQSALGILQQRMGTAAQDFRTEEDQANAEFNTMKGVLQEMSDRRADMSETLQGIFKTTANDAKTAAEAQRTASLAAAKAQQDADSIRVNAERRKQEATHAKNMVSMGNRIALAGGSNSLGLIKKMENADQAGESEISQWANDQLSIVGNNYTSSVLQTEATFTNTVVGIKNNLALNMYNAVKDFNDKQDEYSQLLVGSYASRNAKISQARASMRKTINDSIDSATTQTQMAIETARKEKAEIAKQQAADDRADKRMQFQEDMATKRMEYQSGKDDQRAALADRKADQAQLNQELNQEKKDRTWVQQGFTQAFNSETVKNYRTLRDATTKATDVLQQALESGRLDQSVAKEVVGVLYEKGLDPTSVVREGEYERAGLSQSIYQKGQQAFKMLAGGDTTGLSQDTIDALKRTMDVMLNSQKQNAAVTYSDAINRLMNFNAESKHIKIDPRSIVPQDFVDDWMLSTYLEDSQSGDSAKTPTYQFNWGTYSGQMDRSGDEIDPGTTSALQSALPTSGVTMDEVMQTWSDMDPLENELSYNVMGYNGSDGDLLASLGPVTQDFNTPISTANYDPKTVKAWGGKHDGLDVAMPAGSFVPSLSGGTVQSVSYDKGWGLSVVVKDDDGTEHRYSHLQAVDPYIKAGQPVQRGQLFAQVGKTGNVFGKTGVHLDYRVKQNGQYVDPYEYFS
jgi:murein DD-endopeptidase MepM/ murein hydrolase activator NlpD